MNHQHSDPPTQSLNHTDTVRAEATEMRRNNRMNFWIFVFKTQKLSETEPSVWRSLTDGVDVRRQRAQRPAPVLLDGVG